MNNIGFGFFCFGESYYYKGAGDKIKQIIKRGYKCYILTENPEYFYNDFSPEFLTIYEYDRNYYSYHDKISIVKKIFKNHDIAILIDSDIHIFNYNFLDDLKMYEFKYGISYIDTLENHPSKKRTIGELINRNNIEWDGYVNHVEKICPNFTNLTTIWEYFMIFNKIGISKKFFNEYEKLQIVKEFCDITLQKKVCAAGEGISISVASNLTNTDLSRDMNLYEKLKDSLISVSRRYTPQELWPEWMK